MGDLVGLGSHPVSEPNRGRMAICLDSSSDSNPKLNSASTKSTASTTNIQNRRKKSRKCLDTERDPTFSPEDLAEVPPLKRKFYGDCDDYDLCRRIFVKPTITLKALLQKIHDTYVQMP